MIFDVQNTPAAALSISIEGDEFRYHATNQACRDLGGLSARLYPGLTPHDTFPKAIADLVVERYRACRDSRQAISFMTATGPPLGMPSLWTTLFPLTDPTGLVTSLVAMFSEAPNRQVQPAPQQTLHDKISLAIDAVDAMDSGFWAYEITTGVFETSRSLAALLAGPGHESLDLADYGRFIRAEDFKPDSLLKPHSIPEKLEFRVTTYDGRTRWLESKRRTIFDDFGEPIRIVSFVADITDKKAAYEVLQSEAYTDSLTGLKNRRAFDRIAAQAFETRSAEEPIGLLLFDLDGFKQINDRHGHRAGDEILRKVARRVTRTVRKADTLARIGGDEFAILLRHGTDAMGDALTAKINRAFKKPFALEDCSVSVGISMGVAISTSPGISVEALFEQADQALYAMKRQQRLRSA